MSTQIAVCIGEQPGFMHIPAYHLWNLLVPLYDPNHKAVLTVGNTVSSKTLQRCVPGIVLPATPNKNDVLVTDLEVPSVAPKEPHTPLSFESVFTKVLNQ